MSRLKTAPDLINPKGGTPNENLTHPCRSGPGRQRIHR